MSDTRPFILLGAGGHAKVVLSLLRATGQVVVGVCDPDLESRGVEKWCDLSVLGDDDYIESQSTDAVVLALGVGQQPTGNVRQSLYQRFARLGFRFPALVHPLACVDASVTLSDGVQVMAGAILQTDVSVAENSIINTAASVDHDCLIGAQVHIAPGAVLCGSVTVGDMAFVGSGAVVINGLTIGSSSLVAAGATLRKDLPSGETYFGGGR